MINDYEIPISTKSQRGGSVRAPPPESMYIAMEGGESLQIAAKNVERSEFTDSFETYPDSQPDSGRYEVQKVTNSQTVVRTNLLNVAHDGTSHGELFVLGT